MIPSSSFPASDCSFLLSFVLGSHNFTRYLLPHKKTASRRCKRIQQCDDDPFWICCSPLSNPSLWLLLCPSLPLLLSSSLSLSLSCDGVPGVHRGERAGAVGNKCLIIRLIIIPGGSEAGQGRKRKKENTLTVTVSPINYTHTQRLPHIHKCMHTVWVRQTNMAQAKLPLCLFLCLFSHCHTF